jgi:hypothetical protein
MCTYESLDATTEHLRVPVVELHVFDANEPRGVGIGQGSGGSRQGSSGNRLLALLVRGTAVDDDGPRVLWRLLIARRGAAGVTVVGTVAVAIVGRRW